MAQSAPKPGGKELYQLERKWQEQLFFQAGISSLGNTGGTSKLANKELVLVGGNNCTLSQSLVANYATITIIGATPTTGSISAGTTKATLGEVVFSNSNGVSFGINGQTITASHNGLTSQSNQALSAGNGSFTFQTASFADSNGVSFSTGTQGIYATVKTDYLTSQSNQAISGSNGSFAFQTVTFGNLNGLSFYTSNGSLVGSYTVPGGGANWTISDNATSGTVNQVAFTNLNGITLSLSTGAGGSHTIVGSHNALTSQSNQALSGSNGSFAFQTATFGNLNGLSFYTSNGSMVGSYTVPAVVSQTVGMSNLGNTSGTSGVVSGDAIRYLFAGGNNITLSQSLNGVSGTVTISAFNQSVQTQGFLNSISVIGNTAGNTSAGTGSIVLAGGPNITLSGATAAGGMTLSISGGAGGGGGGFSAGMSNLGITTGTSGTVSGQLVFVGTSGIMLSQSTNGASGTLTILPGPSASQWEPVSPNQTITGTLGNATMFMWPAFCPFPVTATQVNHLVSMTVSSSSNSSHAGTISLSVGVYTLSGSTLSLASSGSRSFNWTNTSNNSTSVLNGMRLISVPLNANFTPGNYFLAFWSRTSTSNANWFTMSNVHISGISNQFSGHIGSTTNSSNQFMLGYGMYSNASFSTAMPSTIHVSNVKGGGAAEVNRLPYINFINTSA